MKIHPKQFFKALKHIKEFWPKGCHCILCHSVDIRKNFVIQ